MPAGSHPFPPLLHVDTAILRTLRGAVLRYALRRVRDRDRAEDVTQEVLTRLLSTIRNRTLPEDCSLDAWVIGIARHVVIDLSRRARRESSHNGAEAASRRGPPVHPDHELEDTLDLKAAMNALTPAERSIIEACYVDGLSCAEIARKRRVPAARIRKRKQRALAKLRAALSSAPA